MKVTDNFFNKLAQEIDKTYFPNVKYYGDDKNDAKVHYAIELFNNGCSTYNQLIDKLAKNCKESKEQIHLIVKKYVDDFEGFEYKV